MNCLQSLFYFQLEYGFISQEQTKTSLPTVLSEIFVELNKKGKCTIQIGELILTCFAVQSNLDYPDLTVAHNCHGKRKSFAAKRITSRQKEKAHGKKNNLAAKRMTSRQKEKARGKKNNLAAKRITSRQKEKARGKKNNFAAKRITSRQKEKAHGKTNSKVRS